MDERRRIAGSMHGETRCSPVNETARGWRIGNSIFRGSEFHGYSLLFGGREYCSHGCASREDRENGNGPRLRRKPPSPSSHLSPSTRYSTALHLSFDSLRLSYKPLAWSRIYIRNFIETRLASLVSSATNRAIPSPSLFVFSCWCASAFLLFPFSVREILLSSRWTVYSPAKRPSRSIIVYEK